MHRCLKLHLLPLICLGLSVLPATAQCPLYTHKDDVKSVSPTALPDGYFVYGITGQNGIYKSPIRAFSPQLIPNTGDYPAQSIEISDDGQWILYRTPEIKAYLIKTDGTHKTPVPFVNPPSGAPFYVGFYRNSPKGHEIFGYVSSSRTTAKVDAIIFDLSTGTPTFGAQRTILQATNTAGAGWDWQMAVVADQLVIRASSEGDRMAFYTIPNGGNGTAGDADKFVWSNSSAPANAYCCAMTMSHDGQSVLFNNGWIGNGQCVPNKFTTPSPMDHKGFSIVPFRRKGAVPAMTWDQSVDAYGTSINWCPNALRFASYTEVDFNQWYFANNKDYVIGLLRGNSAPVESTGVWLVNWKTNSWTHLTPTAQRMSVAEPAVYLTGSTHVLENTSDIDPYDPGYEILTPTGGWQYRIGDTLKIRVRTQFSVPTDVLLEFGWHSMTVLEGDSLIYPPKDSIVRFIIPDSVDMMTGPNQYTRFSLMANDCRIRVEQYGMVEYYFAYSDLFAIVGRDASMRPRNSAVGTPAASPTQRLPAVGEGSGSVTLHAGVHTVTLYDSRGVKVWEYRRSDASWQARVSIPRQIYGRMLFCAYSGNKR